MRRLALALLCLLAACGGAAPPAPTAQGVVDQLAAAGLEIADIATVERNADSPVPNSYDERMEFSIGEVAPDGGQVFVCATKQNCDAIYAYYDALKALAGPYLYQSDGGRIVLQLNSGLTPETAAKFEAAIKALP